MFCDHKPDGFFINYGIKTGFNDAFIISTEKRSEILANSQTEDEYTRTDELIRPILRGRDIKRYGYYWADLWLIATFPSRQEFDNLGQKIYVTNIVIINKFCANKPRRQRRSEATGGKDEKITERTTVSQDFIKQKGALGSGNHRHCKKKQHSMEKHDHFPE